MNQERGQKDIRDYLKPVVRENVASTKPDIILLEPAQRQSKVTEYFAPDNR